VTETPPKPSGNRPGSKRKREPVTLDLEATEVETAAPAPESSLVDDPRTPADPPEAVSAAEEGAQASMPDDPRAEPAPEPSPGEIEAAVERLIPEAGEPAGDAGIPYSQGIAEAPPAELGPGPDALDAASAMPAGAAADRIAAGSVPDEPTAAAAAPEPKRRAGIGRLLAAAALGGLIGAGLTAAAERYWLKSADTAGVRMAQIEQRLAAVPRTDLGPLDQRLSGLEARPRETAERAQAAQAAAEASRGAAEASKTAAERAASRAEQAARPAEPGSAAPAPGGPDAENIVAVRNFSRHERKLA
jgi:hypothetical protein